MFLVILRTSLEELGRDAGAGAALHDRMVYQRRKVQALVIVTDLVCSIVLCNEFVSMFGSQVEFLALLLMISCVRIWFPVLLELEVLHLDEITVRCQTARLCLDFLPRQSASVADTRTHRHTHKYT